MSRGESTLQGLGLPASIIRQENNSLQTGLQANLMEAFLNQRSVFPDDSGVCHTDKKLTTSTESIQRNFLLIDLTKQRLRWPLNKTPQILLLKLGPQERWKWILQCLKVDKDTVNNEDNISSSFLNI